MNTLKCLSVLHYCWNTAMQHGGLHGRRPVLSVDDGMNFILSKNKWTLDIWFPKQSIHMFNDHFHSVQEEQRWCQVKRPNQHCAFATKIMLNMRETWNQKWQASTQVLIELCRSNMWLQHQDCRYKPYHACVTALRDVKDERGWKLD